MNWLWMSLFHAAAMLWETLWALVLGFSLSAIMQVFVSKDQMARAFGRPGLREVALATGFPRWPPSIGTTQLGWISSRSSSPEHFSPFTGGIPARMADNRWAGPAIKVEAVRERAVAASTNATRSGFRRVGSAGTAPNRSCRIRSNAQAAV